MKTRSSLLAAAALAASAWVLFSAIETGPAYSEPVVGHGDVSTLEAAFDAWRDSYEKHGGSPAIFKLSLGYSKGLSDSFTRARARMRLNLLNGELSVTTAGLSDGDYDLWFVDDGSEPGNTVKPEPSDRLLRVGSLVVKSGKGTLETKLTPEMFSRFTLDSAVLAPAGKSPVESVVISGSPDLMTKLYYAGQPWTVTAVGEVKNSSNRGNAPFEFLLPKLAMADTAADLAPVLGAQVALGRQIFHHETFEGNGRTCGTCHRDDNNFTIDPAYIAALPKSDPLFVAETKPGLAGLENPTLMRKYGLIKTNVDGPDFDVYRSVPHLFALQTTIVSERTKNEIEKILQRDPSYPHKPGDFEADNAYANAVGWSGDGAPGSGSLREFTLGAIAQHLPRTLNRSFGVDFRLPTNAELDAIEAYMLSLGRGKDYPVWKLTFNDPLTQTGKLLFDTKQNPCTHDTVQSGGSSPAAICPNGESVVLGATANCNGCHQHAGGRSSTTFANPTRNTGIENLAINPGRLIDPDLNHDGGFGLSAANCGPAHSICYGDGRFNTPPLVEAADTGPYYHNNSVNTLEEAVAAYNSDAFNNSPGAFTSKLANRQVKLDSTQVVAVASFLRAINALENIRLSNRLDNQARQVTNFARARQLAKLGHEEAQDAIRVLSEGVFRGFDAALTKLRQAAAYEGMAQLTPVPGLRSSLLLQAIARKQEAKGLIATCDENAAMPPTAGPSPAGYVYSCAELAGY